MRVEQVVWVDAAESDDTPWVQREDEVSMPIVMQVGYVVSETEDYILLTNAYIYNTDTVGRRNLIPKKSITFRKTLLEE